MKKVFLMVWILVLATSVLGKPVSQQEALLRAQEFMKGKQFTAASGARGVTSSSQLSANYYVFNAEAAEGFVVVSGDDRTVPILGYSEYGSLDLDDVPSNMQAWLEGYADEIEWMNEHDYQPTIVARVPSYSAIAPLVTAEWNQDSPYNDLCPPDPYYNGSPHSVTGCVATAMAQVMYHHKWPAQTTTLIPGYVSRDHGLTVNSIPAGTSIDWNNMLPSYTGDATDVQKLAVAQLMLMCGTSVQMNYTAGESGSNTSSVANALTDYFGYDATYVCRENYAYSKWIDLIYSELAAGRPVQYGGNSSGGGHAFVVDGYKEGLFHVNWGWGGSRNGYFVLSVLNSGDNSGIGASSTDDGYSFGQDAVINVKPSDGSYTEPAKQMTFEDISISGNVITYSAYNLNKEELTFDYGMGFIDNGIITPISNGLITNRTHSYLYGRSNVAVTIDGSSLQPGSYAIVSISKLSSSTKWLTTMSPDYNYIEAIVDNNHNVMLKMHPTSDLTVTGIQVSGTLFKDDVQTANVTISNSGDEFYGVLYFFVSQDASNKGDWLRKGGITIEANSTSDIDFTFTPSNTGKCYMWVTTDEEGNDVIGQGEVDIVSDPYVPTGPLMVSSMTIANADGDWSVDTEGNRIINVYSEEMVLRIRPVITNISGTDLSPTLQFWIQHLNGDTWDDVSGKQATPTIAAGRSVSYIEMSFNVSDYGTYRFVLKMNGTDIDHHYIINYAANKPNIIDFADANVKAICVANWDADGDGELSEEEAAAVTEMDDEFEDNTDIVSFNELEYFTGLTELHHTFDGCENLESVVIPKNIDFLGSSHPFGWCYKLKNIRVADGNTTYDSRDNCNAIIETETNKLVKGGVNTVIPQTVTVIGEDAFELVADLTSITLPSSIETIKSSAFGFTPLTSIHIPASVTSIHNYAFQGTTELQSMTVDDANMVYDSRDNCNAIIEKASATLISGCANTIIPNTVKHIGDNAFCNHEELSTMAIPASVESIGGNAFFRCQALTEICIPASVQSIGSCAFEDCSNLTEVTVMWTTPISITNDIFSNRANATLYVPQDCVDAYKEADYWKEFKTIMEQGTVLTESDRIYAEDASIFIGNTADIDIMLANEHTFTAFQFDLTLPEGISIAQDANGNYLVEKGTRFADDDQQVEMEKLSGNVYRFLSYSLNSAAINSNNGALLTVTLQASDQLTVGSYEATISKVALSTPDAIRMKPSDSSFTITASELQKGDANGDGEIDVTDIVSIVNCIMGNPSSLFSMEAADLNGDGEVDIFDIMLTVRLVMNDSNAANMARAATGVMEEPLWLTTADGEVALTIDNADRFTAFQFDLEVDAGTLLTDVRLAGNNANHSLQMARTGENSYRVLGFAPDNSTLDGSAGAFAVLTLSGGGSVAVSHVLFSTPQEEKVHFSGCQTVVTGISAIAAGQHKEVFDLSGRKLEAGHLPKGVYIINSKKIVIK